ncbi:DUF2076 domain-containing protein [Kushneria phosphatilytica]|uniref:DUF2076 domain-containing protein n=1 Tax=Kushneria phosphatilytica TaxID=657387 RepID=A0A1S1NYS1_9GAMM|nr:DUF2076 domain-containing protein [Kushneria phosphatilytica]OHV10535.1 hypothetical protein BH688_09035 [Kushneria phosphatilytica]QEL11898.1 DUF2076 domain-containing protein [Kushneria phosphatilytica]
MASEEQRLIDDLFNRLKKAEENTGERDDEAEQRIQSHVQKQPAAPYYMAQTILMQEAALKRLQARVERLEHEAREQRSSGGFLAGLFGVRDEPAAHSSQRRNDTSQQTPGWGSRAEPGQGQRGFAQGMSGRGGGFLGGALQTAAGVAGGVMLGNLMMDMFGHHQPEEMVNVIEDPNAGEASAAGDDIDAGSAGAPMDDGLAGGPDDNTGFEDTDFGGMPGFDDDGFDEL